MKKKRLLNTLLCLALVLTLLPVSASAEGETALSNGNTINSADDIDLLASSPLTKKPDSITMEARSRADTLSGGGESRLLASSYFDLGDGVKLVAKPVSPAWKDYTFAGWYDSKLYTGAALGEDDSGDAGKTYYAKWTKNGKTVRTVPLDLNDITKNRTYGTVDMGYGQVWANEDEGWVWYNYQGYLYLYGVTFDVSGYLKGGGTPENDARASADNSTKTHYGAALIMEPVAIEINSVDSALCVINAVDYTINTFIGPDISEGAYPAAAYSCGILFPHFNASQNMALVNTGSGSKLNAYGGSVNDTSAAAGSYGIRSSNNPVVLSGYGDVACVGGAATAIAGNAESFGITSAVVGAQGTSQTGCLIFQGRAAETTSATATVRSYGASYLGMAECDASVIAAGNDGIVAGGVIELQYKEGRCAGVYTSESTILTEAGFRGVDVTACKSNSYSPADTAKSLCIRYIPHVADKSATSPYFVATEGIKNYVHYLPIQVRHFEDKSATATVDRTGLGSSGIDTQIVGLDEYLQVSYDVELARCDGDEAALFAALESKYGYSISSKEEALSVMRQTMSSVIGAVKYTIPGRTPAGTNVSVEVTVSGASTVWGEERATATFSCTIVKATPRAPALTIDLANEKLTGYDEDTMEYSTDGTSYVSTLDLAATGALSTLITASGTRELYVRWKETTNYNASAAQKIEVSARPAVSADYGGDIVPSNQAAVIVDGKAFNIGTTKTEDKVTTVTVDQKELKKQLDTAKEKVVIPVTPGANADTAKAEFIVANVDEMAGKDMTLSVQVDDVSYDMPAAAVDTKALMGTLGASDPEEVSLSVTIKELSKDDVTIENGELVLPPVEFTVTASYGGKSVEVEAFQKYVRRVIEIPDGVDASRITTAVVVENGKQRHVPTEVLQKDGKWYARINSLTNSVYALIWNEEDFTDDDGKWFEAAAAEMASRGALNGRGEGIFAGEAYITRSEFAAVLIRALGLPENGDASVFSDVEETAWYYGAVGKAYEYGLIQGRGAGLFAPGANLTRQEAMAMVRRAAAIAEYAGTTGTLDGFYDAGSISDWALEDAKWNVGSGLISGNSRGEICGQNYITRAETATIVLRLLQKSGLVDVRTEA